MTRGEWFDILAKRSWERGREANAQEGQKPSEIKDWEVVGSNWEGTLKIKQRREWERNEEGVREEAGKGSGTIPESKEKNYPLITPGFVKAKKRKEKRS